MSPLRPGRHFRLRGCDWAGVTGWGDFSLGWAILSVPGEICFSSLLTLVNRGNLGIYNGGRAGGARKGWLETESEASAGPLA